MSQPLTLRVITEAGVVLEEGGLAAVRAPGELGYLGILANHAPLVTTLKRGVLSWRKAGEPRQTRRLGGGLLEVAKNRVTILTSDIA